MNPISIDSDKCVICLKCVGDCPNSFLYCEDGAVMTHDGGCMECGHCYSLCPQNAVIMNNFECSDEKAVSMSEIDSQTLLKAMKSRRTVRQFKDIPVEEDKIAMILEAGRYSPTGRNSQEVSYTILGSKQREAEEICVSLFRKGSRLGALSSFLKRISIDDDFFFKGAPLVIVVCAKNGVDGGLASSYMELMAESLGLGVLYSGFFVMCTKLSRKLKKLLELEKGYDVVTCMVIGYPDVKYQRIAPRRDLKLKRL